MWTQTGSRSLILGVLALAALAVSCNLDQAKGKSGGSVIMSTDKVSQIAVPSGWKPQTKLNDVAVLQAALPVQEMYVIGITEAKADFSNVSLEKYSEMTREPLMKSLGSPQFAQMPKLMINGKPAVQHKIEGSIQNLNIIYLHTAIETDKNYHYLLAWTLKSRFEKNEAILQQIIGSFKEIE